MRNEKVLQTVWEKNILHTTQRKKTNWNGQILRRNCLLKRAIEEKIRGKNRNDGKTRRKT
jgi:hypothetical protein